jgi:hypothetical protein
VSELILQFSSMDSWASSVIRRVCHSPFSHVDIVTPDGLLGASDPGGVQMRPFDYQKFTIRRRARMECIPGLPEKIIETAKTQIGKPFDQEALHAFLAAGSTHVPRDWRDPKGWFCAELATWAMEKNLFWPHKLIINEDCISPSDLVLLINPYVDVDEFWREI